VNSSAVGLWKSRAEAVRPPTRLTVSEWADQHRRLPVKSSAEPGRWRTSRTPYLRDPMDDLSARSDVEEVVLMKAAQIGGTEVILNGLGYVIDHAPGPALLVQPTDGLAKRFSRQRVGPLLTDTPQLKAKVLPARARESGNTVLSKEFPSGILVMTGANSAVGLRSIPAMYLFCDEVDGYPMDVDEEGSPIELAAVRQRTFPRRKRLLVSTPTIAGQSAIETAYENSDQRRFYVPCPHCGERQPLEFPRLVWTKYERPPAQAVYDCRACEQPIEERHKTAMLEAGEWRAERPERAAGKVRGYHLNALYAPAGWISWGDIATSFVKVHKDPEKFRVFVNTVLGEVWKAKGEAPDYQVLMTRREEYALGTLPQGVCFLTAGCDVQKDRIVVEVVGWGRGKQSWSIDYGVLPGDTADLEHGPWSQLDELLNRFFPHAGGRELGIRGLAVDSGYNTNTVYTWTRRYPMNRIFAVKGRDGALLVGSPTPVEVTIQGKKLKRGARVWMVAGNIAKSELYGWLRLEAPTDGSPAPGGYCHFPEYDEEYFKELTSEQLVAHKTRKGYIRTEWEVIPGRENHLLDARIYARAAAALVGLDRYRDSDWAKLEDSLRESQ